MPFAPPKPELGIAEGSGGVNGPMSPMLTTEQKIDWVWQVTDSDKHKNQVGLLGKDNENVPRQKNARRESRTV